MTNNTNSVPNEIKKGITFTPQGKKEELPKLLQALLDTVDTLNEVSSKDDIGARVEATEAVNKARDAYNREATLCAYDDFLVQEDPMKAALAAGYITVKKVVSNTDREMNTVTYSVEDDVKQIDFIAFSSAGHSRLMGAKAKMKASQLGYMVLVQKGYKDGNSIAEITAAYQKSKGKTITKVFKKAPSANEMKAELQELLDEIYFSDNGKGENRFMVTSGWLHWFEDAINNTSYGKGFLTRRSKNPKDIIQTACALYHAYFNKYGVSTAADKENVVKGSYPEAKTKKAEKTAA